VRRQNDEQLIFNNLKKMRKLVNRVNFFFGILIASFFLHLSSLTVSAQSKPDSLAEAVKSKILNHFNHFTIGFYVDTYFNLTLDNKKDTSNLIPFSANCPVRDQIRMNHAAIETYYTAENIRGKFVLQFGDAPNLLALPGTQFIKNIDQANFGFRIVKDLWVDFGYIFNPDGFESSWAINNQISTVTVMGYFEPGNVLGIKLSYKFSPKFSGGIMYGNPYSLAYIKNTHPAGMIFLCYSPIENLTFSYNNYFGHQDQINTGIDTYLLYNNLFITYTPVKQFLFIGQFDMAAQTHSKMAPDSCKTATMFSGCLQARYTLNEKYSLTARFELFNDPDGFLSGVYTFNGKKRGLLSRGVTIGLEYRPVKFGYIRLDYRYLHANDGNKVFYSHQLDKMNILTLTTGVRF